MAKYRLNEMYYAFKHDIDYIAIIPERKYGVFNIDQLLMRAKAFIPNEAFNDEELEEIYIFYRSCLARSDAISDVYHGIKYHIDRARHIIDNEIYPRISVINDDIELDAKMDLVSRIFSRDVVINKSIKVKEDIYHELKSHLVNIIVLADSLIDYSRHGVELLDKVIEEHLKPKSGSSNTQEYLKQTLNILRKLKGELNKIGRKNDKEGMICRQRQYFIHNAFIAPRVTKDTREVIIHFSNDDKGVFNESNITFNALFKLADALLNDISKVFMDAIAEHVAIYQKYDKIRVSGTIHFNK